MVGKAEKIGHINTKNTNKRSKHLHAKPGGWGATKKHEDIPRLPSQLPQVKFVYLFSPFP